MEALGNVQKKRNRILKRKVTNLRSRILGWLGTWNT